MADALQQFLAKRARDDYRDLDMLRPLIADAIGLEDSNTHAIAKMMAHGYKRGLTVNHPEMHQLIEHQLGITPLPPELLQELQEDGPEYAAKLKSPQNSWIFKLQPEPSDFMATHETLRLAGNFGLMLAGEACKKIERTRPELMRQFPDFPWTSLKRLRNYHAHPARYAHAPHLQQRENEAVEKEVQKLETSMSSHIDVPPIDDQAMLALSAGMRYYRAMRILAESEKEGTLVPLQNTPAVQKACYMLSVEKDPPSLHEDALPIMVVEHASYSLMHEINDTLGRISCFYRWRQDSALNNAQLKPMLHLRNRVAHFGGTLRMGDWQRTPEEAETLAQTISKVSSMLDEVPASEDTAQVEQFMSDLAALYKANLLGKAAEDPAKCALLNQAVEKITLSHLSKNQENAYVQTAALLIQRTPPERAEKVLDYVFSKLKRSTQLCMGHDCPRALQADMRDFINYIDIFLASPGARASQISM